MKTPEGLTKFIESCNFENVVAEKADSTALKESLQGADSKILEAVSADEECWWVPISFYNKKNLNGRNYNRKLWENVRDNQKRNWKGSAMLLDHPSGDSDGNPRDICGVWLDLRIGEPDRSGKGLVWGLLCPCGRSGDDLRDFLKKGGRVGTSSSGFGRLMNDGETVDPDTYQIDRCADWVMCPSQSTYFGIGDDDLVEDRSFAESINRSIKINKEERSNTNYTESNLKENTMSTMSKMEEKKFRRDIEVFLEEATSIQNAQERLEEFKEIESYFAEGACSDLKEKVEAKIAECEAFIKEAVVEKTELKESFGIENAKDLERKLTKVVNESKLNEKEARDWKVVAEQMQEKCRELTEELNNKHSDAYVEYLKGKLEKSETQVKTLTESSKEQIEDLQNRLSQMTEKAEKAEEENKKLAESAEIAATKLEESVNSEKDLMDKLVEARDILTKTEEKTTLLESENNNFKVVLEEMKSRQANLVAGAKALKEAVEKKDAENKKLTEAAEKMAKDFNTKSKKMKSKLEEASKKPEPKKVKAPKTEQELYFESISRLHGEEIDQYKERITSARNLTEAKARYWKEIVPNLEESRKLDSQRFVESYTVSKEDKAKAFEGVNFEKKNIVDDMPKGWF